MVQCTKIGLTPPARSLSCRAIRAPEPHMPNALPRPAAALSLSALAQGIGGGLGWSLLPPLMPGIAQELSLSKAALGLIWGLAPAGIALASPFGGAAVDRFG